jgi:DinB family protein
MSTTTDPRHTIPAGLEERILNEGYGPGAWHGADFKAALADVTPELAFWRAWPDRHNIAEIAVHHAFYAHSVRGRLLGTPIEPFVLEGEDWFAISDPARMSWDKIRQTVDTQQQRLAETVSAISAGRASSPLAEADRFNLILGITCHAVYHAGQVQLIKVLRLAMKA